MASERENRFSLPFLNKMQIFITDQISYLIISLALGIVMGIYYDALNLIRLILSNKVISFLTDSFFTLSYGLSIIIATYAKNAGAFRWYSFVASLLSFCLYRISIGKIIIKGEFLIVSCIINIFKYTSEKAKKVLDFFLKFVKINLRRLSSKIHVKRLFLKVKKTYGRKEQYEKRSYKNR